MQARDANILTDSSSTAEDDDFYPLPLQSDIFCFDDNGLPKRLRPKEVYYSIAGIFAANPCYSLEHTVYLPTGARPDEYARIYRHNETSELHILYYPGKDNDEALHQGNNTESLRFIMSSVNTAAEEKYSSTDLAQANKLFVICANNTFCLMPVWHYLLGIWSKQVLTTEDSLYWSYSLQYVADLLPHQEWKQLGHNHQSFWWDNQSCGNHVIKNAHRHIDGGLAPPLRQVIDEASLDRHHQLYQLGLNTSLTMTLSQKNVCHESTDEILSLSQLSHSGNQFGFFAVATPPEPEPQVAGVKCKAF